MVRFLHLADVHLGARNYYLGDRAAARTDEFKAAFRENIEWALDDRNAIDGVLIAGDLFEQHRPEAELWSFAKGLFSRLLAKEKIVAVVPGMHDSHAYKNSVWRHERLPGVEVFLNPQPEGPRVRDVRGRRVFLYGLAYVPGQSPEGSAWTLKRIGENGLHIGLVHAVHPGHPEYVQRPHQLEVELKTLAAGGLDYVALGGSHCFSEHRIGSTLLAYPGALEGRGFEIGETGEKGAIVVEFDDKGVHIERRLTNRKTILRHRIDLRAEKITDAAGLESAIDALSGRDVILEVTLTGTAEFVADLDEIRDRARKGFHHLEIVDDSRIVDSALLRKIESENTIRGYFVRKLGARIDSLKAKMSKGTPTADAIRTLRVLDAAMKLGVEQFVEEEAPSDSIYSMIPDSDELVGQDRARDAANLGNLEERVKAMIEYRKKLQEGKTNDHGQSEKDGGTRGTPHLNGKSAEEAE